MLSRLFVPIVLLTLAQDLTAQVLEFKSLKGPARQTDGSYPPVGRMMVMPNNTILANTLIGLYGSRSSGDTWFSITSASTGFDFTDDGTLYVAHENGCYSTTNEGASWVSLNDELPSTRFYSISAIGDDLVATTRSSVYHSGDNGKTWDNVTALVPSDAFTLQYFVNKTIGGSMLLFTGGSEGYRSTDGGEHWMKTKKHPPYITPVSDKIVMGYYGEFYRSTNDGATWSNFELPYPDHAFVDIAKDQYGRLFTSSSYFGGGNGHLLKSNDSGKTWTDLGFTPAASSIAVDQNSKLYVGSRTGGVYRMLKALRVESGTTASSIATHYSEGRLILTQPGYDIYCVKVYDLLGREVVATTQFPVADAGSQIAVEIDLPSGVYFCSVMSQGIESRSQFIVGH